VDCLLAPSNQEENDENHEHLTLNDPLTFFLLINGACKWSLGAEG
jgi:hypothetical protein